MIQAILLDVDGIIIGDAAGVNFPHPHPEVLKTLKALQKRGIIICFLTARPPLFLSPIIKELRLDCPHVFEAGALILNPMKGNVIQAHYIDICIAENVVDAYIKENVYTELFLLNGFVIQEDQAESHYSKDHVYILHAKPVVVPSLRLYAKKGGIIKLAVISDYQEKVKLERIFQPFLNDLTLQFATHPLTGMRQFGLITNKGISKKQGAIALSSSLNIPLENMLGIGDGLMDLEFMSLCGFCGTLSQADENVKEFVLGMGMRGFVGPSVNENGIINVFEYFFKK